ncbi:hypothetical protein [Patulibacter minatonensis]|uniref:hypothetical protein n=1 Tax=Patulibacter minatonensis TaxID=298163 RepID=UPI00047D9286|nr:hypothetical protein [Patulibacter minatonensis]
MSDTSTDDLRTPVGDDEHRDDASGDVLLDDDGPAEPPVIGCTRCDARVVMGSRYCPSCGVPLVRSGEQAATALSRTRRRAPILVRLLVPLILLGILYAIWYVANLDPLEKEKDSLKTQVSRVVADHRTLSDRLEELEGETDPAAALGAARAALSTLRDVQDETEGVESGTTGRTTRVRRALATDRLYLSAVVSVLADPRSKVLSQLGARSARAAAALKDIDDIANTKDAIRGTKVLGIAVRARASGSRSKPGTTGSAGRRTSSSPFVNKVDAALQKGDGIRSQLTRGFALLRAARDGVSAWDGQGAAPESQDAALDAAATAFRSVATSRASSAARARAIDTKQDNQRAITEKLAVAYEAGAATATKITGCIASFDNTGPEGVARQCLQGVRGASKTEATAVAAFASSYRPAREAAGLTGPVPAF